MDIFGIISLILIVFMIAFIIRAIGMARYKNQNTPIKKPATKDTIYGDRVINAAVTIYCNYGESKIFRPGIKTSPKNERIGQSIQDAINLVNATYKYFDLTDKEELKKKPDIKLIKKPDISDIKIN